MRAKIEKAYRRECGLGVKMSDIYDRAMRKDFGCRTRRVMEGAHERAEFYHPDGKPFPKLKTFVTHVLDAIGLRKVQLTLFGKVRARSKLLPVRGSFTESSWNLMQRVESDAYAVNELPRGYVEGSTLPPLYVTTKRDTTSGIKTGIGFTQGSERASGYRMATFCEAIDKVQFCRLFGIGIEARRWPSKGVSPADIRDRGPGATRDGQSRSETYRPVIAELAPANSGQGKAVIESSHPKTPSNEEAPNFVQSDLRSIELVRKATFELLEFNDTCNIGDRIPPDLADQVSSSTPNGLWGTLSRLGRNDAVEVPFDHAVCAYLDEVPAKLTRDGVKLAGRNYFSRTPEFLSAREAVTGSQALDVRVRVLEACVRHVWLEWNHRLIELDVRYPIAVQNEVLYMSLVEVEQYFKFTKGRDLAHEEHRQAARAEIRADYEEQTGKDWESGRRASGRPKRGGRIAKQEATEAKNATSDRKAA